MQKVKNKLSLLFMFSNILEKVYVTYFLQNISLFKKIFGNLFSPYTCSQRLGLAAVLEFVMSSPEQKPNKITDDEDKNKSSIEFGQPEPLLIANKKMRTYSSASIAANPMLPAGLIIYSSVYMLLL